jgi:RNA polymerase sigma-54 factor
MKNKNVQRASLKLKFVPYLALRAKVFEANSIELNDFINNFFESNPFIEFSNLYSYEDFVFDIPDKEEDIYSFLSHQLNMVELAETDLVIAQYIINNLNEEGYLKLPISSIAKEVKVRVKDVERVLKLVQSLDPPGIAARSLSECFILQLEREERVGFKVKGVITNHLQELAAGKFADISKKYGLSADFLRGLKEKISCLNPSPGLMLKESKNLVRVPDVVIEKDGDGLHTFLNKSCRREFVINEKYRDILDSLEKDKKEEFELLLEKAMWLKRAINQRDELLTRISNKILSANEDFFLGKISYPGKISPGEFSDSPDLSESVVSRLIQNKYIVTPRGLFPMRFFFKRKTVSFNDEEVKDKIKSLINAEDKNNPLTDDEVMQMLLKEGIKIKRRTVAKYRNLLNIPNTNKRRVDR